MNFRLRIFRALALLCIIPGLGFMILGLGIGLQGGGLFWLLAATLVFFGGMLIWRTVEYFKQPSRPAAADLLAVLSLVFFSVISSSLRKSFPDAWGVPDKLGIGRDNADGVIMLVALLIVWTVHRILKQRLLEPAFATVGDEKVASRL